jgi:hypothetical protein
MRELDHSIEGLLLRVPLHQRVIIPQQRLLKPLAKEEELHGLVSEQSIRHARRNIHNSHWRGQFQELATTASVVLDSSKVRVIQE